MHKMVSDSPVLSLGEGGLIAPALEFRTIIYQSTEIKNNVWAWRTAASSPPRDDLMARRKASVAEQKPGDQGA